MEHLLTPESAERLQSGLWLYQRQKDKILPLANLHCTAILGRRQLTVIDTRAGEDLWSLNDLSQRDNITGWGNVIVLARPDEKRATAFQATDGKPLDIPDLYREIANTLRPYDNSLIQIETSRGIWLPGLKLARSKLRRFDPVTGKVFWELDLGGQWGLGEIDEEHFLYLDRLGQARVLHLATGELVDLESAPPLQAMSPSQSFVLADSERIYLFVASRSPASHEYGYSENMPSMQFSGTIIAWNRQTGKLDWTAPITGHHLLQASARNCPLWIFVSRNYVTKGNMGYTRLSLLAINKASGEKVLATEIPTNHGGFNRLEADPFQPLVELISYNMGLRIVPDQQGDAPPELRTPPDRP